MTYTAEEIADVIDRAHDEMLVRGRCKGVAQNPAGSVCLRGAIACAVGMRRADTCSVWSNALSASATRAMEACGYSFVWNDAVTTTDDDVLDAFRITAKGLRNGEIAVR